jgi:hypothetical protein
MKKVLLWAILFLGCIRVLVAADSYKDFPTLLSDERIFLVVKSNSSPYQAIASLSGVELLIQALCAESGKTFRVRLSAVNPWHAPQVQPSPKPKPSVSPVAI